jgi:protein NrfC
MAESEMAEGKKKKVLRREFLVGGGAALAAGALAVSVPEASAAVAKASGSAKSYAQSTGYLVYDSRICWGCQSCMFACSMSHQGEVNPALSRIQIIRDAPSFTKYPLDVVMAVCRQCVSPLCVQNCPVGAAHIDAAHGNVRVIDQNKCVGCKQCIKMCPQRPHRTVWNPYKNKSSKCDLCIDAPFWSRKGGPNGEPACVTICPAKALKIVHNAPSQEDVSGYDVNLTPAAKNAKQPPAKS